MSHFTVLVVAEDEDGLNERMAPYQENNMGDCPMEYMEFNNTEGEYREEYENDSSECVRLADGAIAETRDYCDQGRGVYSSNNTYTYPEGSKLEQIPHKERYGTFQTFMRDWAGSRYDEEEQAYGYWENPNAKWDWFQVGGRWTGTLRLKPEVVTARKHDAIPAGHEPVDGSPGIMTTPNVEIEHTDSCLAGQIDIEWHKMTQRDSAAEKWEEWHSSLHKWRAVTREDWDGMTEKQVIETRTYRFDNSLDMLTVDEGIRLAENTKDDYMELFGAPKALTYAFISGDGEWNGRGRMGWWGVSSDEDDDYDKVFWSWVESLNPAERVYVVDCHI